MIFRFFFIHARLKMKVIYHWRKLNSNTEFPFPLWKQKIQVGGKIMEFTHDSLVHKYIRPNDILSLLNCKVNVKPFSVSTHVGMYVPLAFNIFHD